MRNKRLFFIFSLLKTSKRFGNIGIKYIQKVLDYNEEEENEEEEGDEEVNVYISNNNPADGQLSDLHLYSDNP